MTPLCQKIYAGLDAYKQLVTEFPTAFLDAHFSIEDMIGEGDKVVARYPFRGTNWDNFMGTPSTGKKVMVMGIRISCFVGGRIQIV